MQEFNVILRKTRIAEMIVDAKDKVEAEKKAIDVYERGYAEWGEEDVEVAETEEI